MKNGMSTTAALLALLFLVGTVAPAAAEDAELAVGIWQKDFEIGLNVLQSSYSDNWHGGEKGSVVWAARFDGVMRKRFSEIIDNRNTLKLVYGQTHNQDWNSNGDLYWKRPDKTDDLIDFESLWRFTLNGYVDPFVSITFKSMFEDRTDPLRRIISFNPKKFKETVGVSRMWRETEDSFLMSRFGAAFIQNRRAYYPSTMVDETSTEGTTELAAELITEYKGKTLDDRVDWESKLTMTLPFAYSGKSAIEDDLTVPLADYGLPEDLADYTTALDVDFENTFSTNITKVISVKLFVRWVYMKYDNSVKPVVENGVLTNETLVKAAIRKSGQFKQTLALGFGYKF